MEKDILQDQKINDLVKYTRQNRYLISLAIITNLPNLVEFIQTYLGIK